MKNNSHTKKGENLNEAKAKLPCTFSIERKYLKFNEARAIDCWVVPLCNNTHCRTFRLILTFSPKRIKRSLLSKHKHECLHITKRRQTIAQEFSIESQKSVQFCPKFRNRTNVFNVGYVCVIDCIIVQLVSPMSR